MKNFPEIKHTKTGKTAYRTATAQMVIDAAKAIKAFKQARVQLFGRLDVLHKQLRDKNTDEELENMDAEAIYALAEVTEERFIESVEKLCRAATRQEDIKDLFDTYDKSFLEDLYLNTEWNPKTEAIESINGQHMLVSWDSPHALDALHCMLDAIHEDDENFYDIIGDEDDYNEDPDEDLN